MWSTVCTLQIRHFGIGMYLPCKNPRCFCLRRTHQHSKLASVVYGALTDRWRALFGAQSSLLRFGIL